MPLKLMHGFFSLSREKVFFLSRLSRFSTQPLLPILRGTLQEGRHWPSEICCQEIQRAQQNRFYFFQKKFTHFEDEMAILKAISPVDQPFDILDNTVNIINNYMSKDGPGIVLLDTIMHAAKKVSKEIKLPCPFHKLLMSNDFQTIELAGHVLNSWPLCYTQIWTSN